MLEIDGMRVEIGKPISTDGGVVFVARRIRRSAWFKALVPELRKVVAAVNGQRYGFAAKAKLSRTLVALIAGLAMGYRSGKEIADVIGADRLWREVLGARVTQIDLSRLVGILADRGLDPLRRGVLASASEGGRTLHLDGDSSLLALHGKQEGGAWNGHYQEFGYHAGWLFDRSGRLAALWLMEGNAHTAQGQSDQLTWMLEEGRSIASYRGDAGMPSARLLKLLDKEHVDFVLRLRANSKLDELAQDLCPDLPRMGGAIAFSEFTYRAKTWDRERRVAVKFQVPMGEDGAPALFTENFYFVTSSDAAPDAVVERYLRRGEAERLFGEFKAALEPTFRHAELGKNQIWAQFLALAHNVLVDLRDRIDGGRELKPRPSLKPLREGSGWSVLATAFHWAPVRPTLNRFRAFALKLANGVCQHARTTVLRLHPQHLKPAWPMALAPT
jgi:hypothetical protein